MPPQILSKLLLVQLLQGWERPAFRPEEAADDSTAATTTTTTTAPALVSLVVVPHCSGVTPLFLSLV
jgi:hypothetical protein